MNIRFNALGRTGMNISVIGLGAWAIGGSWRWGWGAQDDADSEATIRAAVERGVNWIDTAPAYGLGHSESVVGRVLADMPSSERPYVFTKCGLPWKEGDDSVYNCISPDSIEKEVEESLRRLKLEVIDLYQIHWPVPDEDIEAAWSCMAALKKKGKVRHIGVSNFSLSQLERAEAIAPVETSQPNYSILEQQAKEDTLPWCADRGVGVISYSPMASGMLSGKMSRERVAALPRDDWRKSHPNFKEPRFTLNLALTDLLRTIGRAHNCGPGEVAIAWVLSHPAVSGAIVGMRRPDQTAVVGAHNLILTDDELGMIDSFIKEHPALLSNA